VIADLADLCCSLIPGRFLRAVDAKGREEMRRLPVLLFTLAIMLCGLTALTRQGGASSNEMEDFTGSWRFTIDTDDLRTIHNLTALTADGVVISSGSPVQPAPPGTGSGVVFSSTAIGSWEQIGPVSANVTFVHILTSAEGQPLGTLTVRLSLHFIDDDHEYLYGSGVSTVADVDGNTVAESVITVRAASRMHAQAPVIPAVLPGTPTEASPVS
jgi:hypothetical protein